MVRRCDIRAGPHFSPGCCNVVCTGVTRMPPVYISLSLPSDKLQLTSLTACLEGLSLCQCPDFLLLTLFPIFIRDLRSCSVLNERMATLGCAVTNWHTGGSW